MHLFRRHRPSLAQGLSSLTLVGLGLFGLFHLPPGLVVWAFALLVGTPTPDGQTMGADGIVHITDDRGGPVVERLAYVLTLERDYTKVVVEGVCASACTLHLPSPGTCSTPDALWMFHPIGYPDGHRSPFAWLGQQDRMQQRLTDAALHRFPAALEAWQRAIPQGQERWVAGQDLIDAGWIAACPQPGRQSVAWAQKEAARLSVPPVPVWDLPSVKSVASAGYSPSPPSP